MLRHVAAAAAGDVAGLAFMKGLLKSPSLIKTERVKAAERFVAAEQESLPLPARDRGATESVNLADLGKARPPGGVDPAALQARLDAESSEAARQPGADSSFVDRDGQTACAVAFGDAFGDGDGDDDDDATGRPKDDSGPEPKRARLAEGLTPPTQESVDSEPSPPAAAAAARRLGNVDRANARAGLGAGDGDGGGGGAGYVDSRGPYYKSFDGAPRLADYRPGGKYSHLAENTP